MPRREDIDQIIEAGLYAASGMGRQSSIIVAVTNRAVRDRLAADNARIGGWDAGFDPFYGAPAILIVLAPKSEANRVYDGSLVMGNLMLRRPRAGVGQHLDPTAPKRSLNRRTVSNCSRSSASRANGRASATAHRLHRREAPAGRPAQARPRLLRRLTAPGARSSRAGKAPRRAQFSFSRPPLPVAAAPGARQIEPTGGIPHDPQSTSGDIPAVAAIYERIHDREEAGAGVTGWKRGVYPTEATARAALNAGDLFVDEREGMIVAAARIDRAQVAEYAQGQLALSGAGGQGHGAAHADGGPQCRRAGRGHRLCGLLRALRPLERGCPCLRMDTNEKNAPARALYKRLGYREAGIVRSDFNGLGQIRLVCLEKRLDEEA